MSISHTIYSKYITSIDLQAMSLDTVVAQNEPFTCNCNFALLLQYNGNMVNIQPYGTIHCFHYYCLLGINEERRKTS